MVSEAKNNRNAMPTVAAFVDEIRAQGFEVRVIYAKEGEIERGRKPEYREVFDIPKHWRAKK